MIEVEPILNEIDFRRTLAEVRELMRSDPIEGSQDAHRYHILGLMAEAYESEHHPIDDNVDPIDLIKERVEQKGMSRAELADILGGQNRVSEVLNRTRPLTLVMVRRLSKALNVPADALVLEYPLRDTSSVVDAVSLIAGIGATPIDKGPVITSKVVGLVAQMMSDMEDYKDSTVDSSTRAPSGAGHKHPKAARPNRSGES